MRIDVQVEFQVLARQLMFGSDVVVLAVVELDFSEVLARYPVHIFNVDPKSGAFQHSALIYLVPRLPGECSASRSTNSSTRASSCR